MEDRGLEFFKKLLGGSNDKEIKKLRKTVDAIDALEPKYQKMTDEELRGQTQLFRERVSRGESLDDLLPEAYAVVREGAVRAIGQRPFPVQMIGGIVLHQGRIAEMRTGEGKTLRRHACPLILNALDQARACIVVTVNDYLANARRRVDGQGLSLPGHERRRWSCMAWNARSAPRRLSRAISPTAPTTSSGSTICATTWP